MIDLSTKLKIIKMKYWGNTIYGMLLDYAKHGDSHVKKYFATAKEVLQNHVEYRIDDNALLSLMVTALAYPYDKIDILKHCRMTFKDVGTISNSSYISVVHKFNNEYLHLPDVIIDKFVKEIKEYGTGISTENKNLTLIDLNKGIKANSSLIEATTEEGNISMDTSIKSIPKHRGFGYVIFCKILKTSRSTCEELANSFTKLDLALSKAKKTYNCDTMHPSIIGGFVYIDENVEQAIRCSRFIAKELDKYNIVFKIGISNGRVDELNEIVDKNLFGNTVNLAARYASVEGNTSDIVFEKSVVDQAKNAAKSYNQMFGSIKNGQVKDTKLKYAKLKRKYWKNDKKIKNPRIKKNYKLENTHIVLFDIEKFSLKKNEDQLNSVRIMKNIVHKSIESFSLNKLMEEPVYHPGGDGGVFMFHKDQTSIPLKFSQELLRLAKKNDLKLRIGIHTGQVALFKERLPIGTGILQTDYVSSKATTKMIAVSDTFWKKSLDDTSRDQYSIATVKNTSIPIYRIKEKS